MTWISDQMHLPEEYHEACERLNHLVAEHARRLLSEHYWTDQHLNDIQQHSKQSYTYIRDDDYDAFADTDEYLYSRFGRGIFQRVTSILNAHADEYNAFHFVINTLQETQNEERKIRSGVESEMPSITTTNTSNGLSSRASSNNSTTTTMNTEHFPQSTPSS